MKRPLMNSSIFTSPMASANLTLQIRILLYQVVRMLVSVLVCEIGFPFILHPLQSTPFFSFLQFNPAVWFVCFADVPEGSFIVRAHTPMSNLFSCLWFNEVDRFTSRDQLSFAYTYLKLRRLNPNKPFYLNMFKVMIYC